MSGASKDGGPAFPLFPPPSETGGQILAIQWGMSLRQFYKASILQGIMANSEYLRVVGEEIKGKYGSPKVLSAHAAELADAMLAEDEEHAKK